jgi:predicted SAM-dependent methyltransferase
MKLHLGCGQVYLDGYTNIDYPLSEHSVQHKSIADKLADITKLRYKTSSIEEVRLHHVFEHFDRATACALVLVWRSWLKPSGLLHIEVPDFERTAHAVLSPLTSKQRKLVGMRHIFGSQEAHWAVHYYGWSESSLRELLESCGYEDLKFKRNSWKGTYNIEVLAHRTTTNISALSAVKICRTWLKRFMVDDSRSERDLLKYWSSISQKQIKTGWAK